MANSHHKVGRIILSATLALALVACGGGDSSAPTTGGGTTATVTPPTTPTPTDTCAVSNQIAFADDVLDQFYLFPDLLDNTVDPANFTTVQSFLDARVAPARAQSRDKFFTFATSIAEENALISSGSSAGFGIRLVYDVVNNRVFLSEAFESAPGFQAGLDRGSELVAIGISSSTLQSVQSLMASGGPQAVINALGPSDAGVTRVIRFAQVDGTVIEASITKSDFSLDPISDRYGAVILNDGGRSVAYFNLRTFIVGTSDRELVDVFQDFSDQGITEFIIDFRYNGGGLVRIAELMGDLMRGPNIDSVFSSTVLRASQSDLNEIKLFESQTRFLNAQSNQLGSLTNIPAVNPVKIAFIGTGSTASASELVANAMLPYVDADNIALVGSNTSGKPVGQFGFDFAECDLRVRAVTFQTLNANGDGDYFTGLSSVFPNTCRANDDIFTPLGDASEASIATSLDFLAGRSCTPIATSGSISARGVGGRQPLQPEQPNAAQFEMPGLF